VGRISQLWGLLLIPVANRTSLAWLVELNVGPGVAVKAQMMGMSTCLPAKGAIHAAILFTVIIHRLVG
jgi:hypothetical protein